MSKSNIKKINFILFIFVLIFLNTLFAAKVGDVILNRAVLNYKVSDLEKNITTNEVNATIGATPAQIEFLSFSPDSNESVIVEPTLFYNNKDYIPLPKATLPGGEIVKIPSKIGIQKNTVFNNNDLAIIRVIDLDQDINISSQDTIKIDIQNPRTKEIEKLILKETSNNSGIFIGYINFTNKKSSSFDGLIYVKNGDIIEAMYEDNIGSDSNSTKKRKIKTLLKAKIQIIESNSLFVSKKVDKKIASIGDFVKYTITISNQSNVRIKNIKFKDIIPTGLKIKLNSVRLNNKSITFKYNGKNLSFNIDSLDSKGKVIITYIAEIGATDKKSLINSAFATSPQSGQSNIAIAKVDIKSDFFNEKGYILGQVYYKDENNTKKPINRVRLFLDDGRYAITDKDGKYHFINLSNGTHIIQIDINSIKGRFKLTKCNQDNRFAKSLKSAFVDIENGQMHRVDFCLKKIIKNYQIPKLEAKIIKLSNNKIRLIFNIKNSSNIFNKDIFLRLPNKIKIVPNSFSQLEIKKVKDLVILPFDNNDTISIDLKINNNIDDEIVAILFYDSSKKRDLNSKKISFIIKKDNKKLTIIDEKIEVKIPNILKTQVKTDFNWHKAKAQESMPNYTKELIDKLVPKAAFLWPKKDWIPSIPSTKVAIAIPKGARVELKLNGYKVNMVHYEGLFRGSKLNIIHFKGIDLYEGKNHFEAIIKKGKKVIAKLTRDIFVESHAPASAKIIKKYSYLVADGINPPVIAVELKGKSGHLLRGGLKGSYSVNSPYEPLVVSNNKGSYEVESKGIAYIKLKPSYKGGKVKLLINGIKLETKLKPKYRDWIVVGYAKGTIGYEILKNHSINSRSYLDLESSFFAQGKIKGSWLLTLAYNSKKEDKELFDRIDPNRYYTLYQDNSKSGNSAISKTNFYIKIEKDDFYALYGDFNTNFNDTLLSNYSHNYNGFSTQYNNKNLTLKAFLTKSDKSNIRDKITPDGTNGYYQLSNKDIIIGSEEIFIQTRDKNHPSVVIKNKQLKANIDYSINYIDGTIYFKNPIYKYDNNFNPNYIIAKYQIEGKSNKLIYGARGVYENNRTKVGLTYVKEEDKSEIIGFDSKFKIDKNISSNFEVSQYKDYINNKKNLSKLLEINYKNREIDAKIYYKDIKTTTSDIEKSSEYGIRVNKKINSKYNLNFEAYRQNSSDTNSNNFKNIIINNLTYKDSNLTWSIGHKFQKSSDSKSSNFLTLNISKQINDKLNLIFNHEQRLNGSQESKSILSTRYKYDQNSSLNFAIQRISKNGETKYEAKSSIEYKPYKNTTIRVSKFYNQNELYDTYSIQQHFNFSKKIGFDLGFEHATSSKNKNKDYSSFNIKSDFKDKNSTTTISIGYKTGTKSKTLNFNTQYYLLNSKSTAIALGFKWYQNWSDEINRYINANINFVYRPNFGKLIILDKLEFKDDYKKANNQKDETLKFINNLHLNYQENNRTRFSSYFGLKYAIATINENRYNSFVGLFGFSIEKDIKEDLTLGARTSILYSFSANNSKYSLGLFAIKTLNKNMQIIAGYNFSGFRDDDFSTINNSRQGIYLQFRMKFDQDSLKPLLNKVSE